MRSLILVAILLLSACREEQPAQPTSEQSAQLNDADQMLNSLDNSAAQPR